MNLGFGAKLLQELGNLRLVNVPANLLWFDCRNLPRFADFLSDNVTYSLKIGQDSGAYSGSHYDYNWTNKIGSRLTSVTKHYLNSDRVVDELELAIKDLNSNFSNHVGKEIWDQMIEFNLPHYIGVVYKTYPFDVPYTFFAQATSFNGESKYKIQVGAGNTNGFKFNPKFSLMGSSDDFKHFKSHLDSEDVFIKVSTIDSIFSQIDLVLQHVVEKYGWANLIIEGKIIEPGTYDVQGPMLIDIYPCHYKVNDLKSLDHFNHISFYGRID